MKKSCFGQTLRMRWTIEREASREQRRDGRDEVFEVVEEEIEHGLIRCAWWRGCLAIPHKRQSREDSLESCIDYYGEKLHM